jgi:hypothetical protein
MIKPQMNADKRGSFLFRAELGRDARSRLELLYDNPKKNCPAAWRGMRKRSNPILSEFICG